MIRAVIEDYRMNQKQVSYYSDEHRKYAQAVAGDVSALHYLNIKGWSGPEEFLVCKKRETYRKMIQASDRYRASRNRLRRYLHEISSDTLRRIIWLRFYYKKSWEDVGKRVHLTPSAAKMRWHRYLNCQKNKGNQQACEIRKTAG